MLLRVWRSTLVRTTFAGWVIALLPLLLWPGLLGNLFNTRDFEGHNHALTWPASLLFLEVSSDVAIGLSYVAISASLAYFVHRARRDIPFGWVVLSFGLFIVTCGITHFMHVLTLWTPVFWLDGYAKLITAIASAVTAVVLPPLIPRALAMVEAARLSEGRRRALESANRVLEERNAEQETFIYTVSHDLRTPLLSLRGMAELLGEALEARDDEEARFMLGRIRGNVDRMGELLDDLLSFSRAGRDKEDAAPHDLGEVAQRVMQELEGSLRDRAARLEAPNEWPRVTCSASESYQVLANLIGNALKFGGRPDEAPRVRVTWRPAGDFVHLTVEDNGRGVPERYRDKVFALFQRLDPSAPGTGVGLAIVKRIAERLGGRAWVEDSSLGGAAFHVTLPAA
ncbi:MAG TPA: HAMP domain-containing sensor histidine kinase [Deinococcales bacterium]|nr:HAMP domain-containing sensor histidine kinase [Deinococcales bacterium]